MRIGGCGLVLLAALFAACGGDEDAGTLISPGRYGVIEGRVRGPLGGFPVGLSLEAVAGAAATGHFQVSTETDSAGNFRIAAPFGGYLLTFGLGWRESVEYWSDDAEPHPDTIWLHPAQPNVRLNPHFAALRVRIPVPAGWAGGAPVLHAGRSGPGFLVLRLQRSGRVRDGQFEWLFPGLPPGQYFLSLAVGDDAPAWLPFEAPGGHADRIELPPSGSVEVAYTLPPPAVLSGEVRGSWEELSPRMGGAFRPALVYVEDDSTTLGYGHVDDRGRFNLVTYRPGPLRILVWNSGVERWVGGGGFADATRFPLARGVETAVPVEPESGVLFHFSFDGAPVYGPATFYMELYDANGALVGDNSLMCDICASYGNLAGLANLRPGTYYAHARNVNCRASWPTQWFSGAAVRSEAVPIRIARQGELVELDWDMSAGGSLHGEVPDWDRWPEGSRLVAYPRGDTLEAACDPFTIILKQRSVEFESLLAGPYLLALRVPRDGGERLWWYPGTWSVTGAESLHVAVGDTTVFGPWEFPR